MCVSAIRTSVRSGGSIVRFSRFRATVLVRGRLVRLPGVNYAVPSTSRDTDAPWNVFIARKVVHEAKPRVFKSDPVFHQ